MSGALIAIFAIAIAAIPLAIVATTTFLDRRKNRRVPANYDTEGA